MEATLDRPEVDMNKPGAEPPAPTFEERLAAVEKMKANLVAEARTRLEQIGSERTRLDAEEVKIRAFLGPDAPPLEPVFEKKPKAPRGSVRGPVMAYYRDNANDTLSEGVYPTIEVAKGTGLEHEQVQGAAAKLAKDGLLERIGKSSYRWKAQAA